MEGFESTRLWRHSLGQVATDATAQGLDHLRSAYFTFRERAAALTGQIAKTLSDLTIHDITHLDALWETADLIAGEDYPFSPLEGFILGGAILLHDSALCFEAYSEGVEGLRKTVEWRDAYAAVAMADDKDISNLQSTADFAAMRALHAKRAKDLGVAFWINPEGDRLHLIPNDELRKYFGTLIGEIAASHHWPIEDVMSRLPQQINAPAGLPKSWRVDPVKIACLLRCADAAHLDARRAPDFLRALIKRNGLSADHWTAQNWLERADLDQSDPKRSTIIFTSAHPFDENHASSWWVAFDAINLVQQELESSGDLLSRRPQAAISPPFAVSKVTGANVPTEAAKHIRVAGWAPRSARVHVGNVEKLVRELGGSALYGDIQPTVVVLREIIQNARDAIAARRSIEPDFVGRICVRLQSDRKPYSISVTDDGIGMSERVALGPLLDFGSSFWSIHLVQDEFPGLISSGYKSVGKFGIGFYSIFMVASKATISTRRFDAGIDSTITVKFPAGMTLRPIISFGKVEAVDSWASTRVLFELKDSESNPSLVTISTHPQGEEYEKQLQLRECLQNVCAGLDVDVLYGEDSEKASIVHKSVLNIKTDLERKDWLLSICGVNERSSEYDVICDHARRLRPIVLDEKVIGLAALSLIVQNDHNLRGSISTVGGLAPFVMYSDRSRFLGFIDHEPGSAKRDLGQLAPNSLPAIQAWADEQVDLVLSGGYGEIEYCLGCCSLADLQIDPMPLFKVLVRINDNIISVSVDQLIDIIVESGLAVYQSVYMPHIETYHRAGQFRDIPTFQAVRNSNFLSLKMEDGEPATRTSMISCIHRRAAERSIRLKHQLLNEVAQSQLGVMHVTIITAE